MIPENQDNDLKPAGTPEPDWRNRALARVGFIILDVLVTRYVFGISGRYILAVFCIQALLIGLYFAVKLLIRKIRA